MKTNYANGKLLITGEYLVLEGANSLAIPCAKGQKIDYVPNNKINTIDWTSLDYLNNKWFSANFEADSLDILSSSDNHKAKHLQKMLIEAYKLSNNKLSGQIKTTLEFPNNWGLGSSSTLIVCISKLLKINPLDLHFKSSNGSGYDVACGIYNKAITYLINNKKPIIKEVDFNLPFSKNIYFIHLNKKQKSEKEIIRFKKEIKNKSINVNSISEITSKMIECDEINLFNELIEEHENIISYYINKKPIKNEQFSDFKGAIKSLGAWGGDFIMASAKNNCSEYFRSKGFNTVISYDEMIKNPSINVNN